MNALILGGSGDIGKAINTTLQQEEDTITFIPDHTQMDLYDPNSIIDYFKYKKDFDILVHSAGYNQPRNIESMSEAEALYSYETNVLGFIRVVQQCLPYWKEKHFGRIVVIGSLYSFMARQNRLPYVMAKHSLLGAVRELALELAQYNVLINMVSPGFIDTKMTRQNNNKKTIDKITSNIPLKRMGTAQEIANLILYLCTKNDYITGQNIVVDGGYSIGGFRE